jgi:cob(I)alamin adenosyltransferase
MKIYTKTGDKGLTSLIGGTRVSKHHLRIESYGTVDELNACIGLILAQNPSPGAAKVLLRIQDRLFVMGALLAADPERSKMKLPELTAEDSVYLEREIDAMTAVLPELRHFILPGGSPAGAACHLARCVCRRAERIVVHLAEESVVDEKIIIYLNRLSDYLFTLSRKLNADSGSAEHAWIPEAE